MFTNIVNSVNGSNGGCDSSVQSGTNKGTAYYKPAPKVVAKVYYGDRFINGKFMKAGYY